MLQQKTLKRLLRFQSKEIISNKSKGLDEVILEQGKNLSGGQKQRLSIARGIVRNTPILILDDSFSALDYKTDKTLRQALADSRVTEQHLLFHREHQLLNIVTKSLY